MPRLRRVQAPLPASALRSIEDIFRLSHLGDASMPQVKAFGRDVYTRR